MALCRRFSATLDCMSEDTGATQDRRAGEALAAFGQSLADCQGCGLAAGRTQVVFGVGDPEAQLMFVGEGPGFHEDRQGEPFVGQAGKLLTELLGSIGLSRSEVYIANVVKCRPPENRDPAPSEIEACSPHLIRQIEIIRPRVICTLGRFATKLLAETELSITAIHGKAKEVELGGVPVLLFPVFHPAAALYTPANRKVLEEDFGKLSLLLTRGVQALTGAAQPGGNTAKSEPVDEGVQAPRVPAVRAGEKSDHSTEQLPLW
jgi:uracil-DNA glycosylase